MQIFLLESKTTRYFVITIWVIHNFIVLQVSPSTKNVAFIGIWQPRYIVPLLNLFRGLLHVLVLSSTLRNSWSDRTKISFVNESASRILGNFSKNSQLIHFFSIPSNLLLYIPLHFIFWNNKLIKKGTAMHRCFAYVYIQIMTVSLLYVLWNVLNNVQQAFECA